MSNVLESEFTKRVKIDGKTKFGGVLGKSIGHTLSPLIHNTSAAELGLNVVYLPFDFHVPPTQEFFNNLELSNVFGFNVTVPFKEHVARLLSSEMLSCNTLVPKAEGWACFSTDGIGFLQALRLELGHALTDFEAVFILGFGGAAKALVSTIREQSPSLPIQIFARKVNPSDALSYENVTFANFEPENLCKAIEKSPKSLVIQSTSAPLHGDDLARFSSALISLKGAFVDLVYGQPSALLQVAEQKGLPCQDGIPMLVYQALESQKLWWGQYGDARTLLKLLNKTIKEKTR